MTRAPGRWFDGFIWEPGSGWDLWERCRAGREPAESLCTSDRADLIAELHLHGFTDADIAAHTRSSTYTVGRIRDRLGLPPHRDRLARRAAS